MNDGKSKKCARKGQRAIVARSDGWRQCRCFLNSNDHRCCRFQRIEQIVQGQKNVFTQQCWTKTRGQFKKCTPSCTMMRPWPSKLSTNLETFLRVISWCSTASASSDTAAAPRPHNDRTAARKTSPRSSLSSKNQPHDCSLGKANLPAKIRWNGLDLSSLVDMPVFYHGHRPTSTAKMGPKPHCLFAPAITPRWIP